MGALILLAMEAPPRRLCKSYGVGGVVTSAAVIALLEREMNGWGRRGGADRDGHASGDATTISEQLLNLQLQRKYSTDRLICQLIISFSEAQHASESQLDFLLTDILISPYCTFFDLAGGLVVAPK